MIREPGRSLPGRIGFIKRIQEFGDFVVYQRCWREPGLKRYTVICDSTGRILEEFRRKAAAAKWAKEQSN